MTIRQEDTGIMNMTGAPVKGTTPGMLYSRFSSGVWSEASTPVPAEMALAVFVDGIELVTILCTPVRLTHLVLGFLYSEGIITSTSDIASMRVCEEDSLADVRLGKPGFKPPERRVLGSGCGGGVSFAPHGRTVASDMNVTPLEILSLMKQLNEKSELHRLCGGVHTSALADNSKLLVVAEDIGRHNTLDKIMGECLLTGLSTRDRLLLTSGRISSEMLSKASKMETPVVVSRSSPTDKSIALAQGLGITLIGYVRGTRLSVYSHGERLQVAGLQGHPSQ